MREKQTHTFFLKKNNKKTTKKGEKTILYEFLAKHGF